MVDGELDSDRDAEDVKDSVDEGSSVRVWVEVGLAVFECDDVRVSVGVAVHVRERVRVNEGV